MLRPWKKQKGFESRLRAHRAEPREKFFDELVARATPTRATPTRATPSSARTRFRRPALAAALTVALLGALAGLGGVSYASFKAPVTVIKKLALPASTPHHTISHQNGDSSNNHRNGDDSNAPSVKANRDQHDGNRDGREHLTSGDGQYGFTICHIPPGNPDNQHTITVGSIAAVNAHLRHGDHLGPC
jgi:hypothetical protein